MSITGSFAASATFAGHRAEARAAAALIDLSSTVVAVDVGGTNSRIGLVSSTGEVLSGATVRTVPGPLSAFGENLANAIAPLMEGPADSRPIAIGIGMRGIIDARQQKYLSGSLFSHADQYDLVTHLREHLGVPTTIGNDVKAAAHAELLWGGIGDTFSYVNIGTGIAVAIVEDGRLLHGANARAGEIAYYIIDHLDGDGVGLLEETVSGEAFERVFHTDIESNPNSYYATAEPGRAASLFKTAFQEGEVTAVNLVRQTAHHLSRVILNIESIAGSGRYVMGGGVLDDGQWLVDEIRNDMNEIAEQTRLDLLPTVSLSQLGARRAGLLGAAAMGFLSVFQ